MTDTPQPTRGMPRSLLYAVIPGGFAAIVLVMLLMGTTSPEAPVTDGVETAPLSASESPPTTDTGVTPNVVPTPSGPEGRDNATIID